MATFELNEPEQQDTPNEQEASCVALKVVFFKILLNLFSGITQECRIHFWEVYFRCLVLWSRMLSERNLDSVLVIANEIVQRCNPNTQNWFEGLERQRLRTKCDIIFLFCVENAKESLVQNILSDAQIRTWLDLYNSNPHKVEHLQGNEGHYNSLDYNSSFEGTHGFPFNT